MKTSRLVFLLIALVISAPILHAQRCDTWANPFALSDSLEDNRNAFLACVSHNSDLYYVFWDRTLDLIGSEIVCTDYYDPGNIESVVLAEGYNVSNPKVISTHDWYPPTDTIAFVFYETDQDYNKDIYYVVMTENGFTEPVPFAVTAQDETHLQVSPGGGMVWQEGEAIRYCHLDRNNSGFYFEPVITIDIGQCGNPDIQKVARYSHEEYIAWEKQGPTGPQTRYSMWDFENEAWSEPYLLYVDDDHSNIKFSGSMEIFGESAILVSDLIDSTGNNYLSAHDFVQQSDFISEFSQTDEFLPDLFTVVILTDDIWGMGYFVFRYNAGQDNTDIYSSDDCWMQPEFSYYCMVDNTATNENNPQLFEGGNYVDRFDLICIWESWRNGHWQLFTSKTLVVIGNVSENPGTGGLNVRTSPNPFTGSFDLEFNSKNASQASVKIYNYSGQLVKVLDRIASSAGENSIKIDARGLPPGIYLLSLESGGYNGKIKIIKN